MKKILGIICCVLLVGILTFMGVFALSPKVRNSLLDSWGISYEKNEDDAPILDGMPDPDDSTDIPVVETIAFSFEYDDYVVELTMTAGSIVLKHTRTGLSLTAVGENPGAADAAGIKVIKYKYTACILGAAISGIGGAFYLLDCTRGSLEYVIEAMGWLAVALVIFSLWRPNIGILGSFIFGLLYILPNYVEGVGFAEKEILKIVPYAVTALVLIVISFFNKKETQPPAGLGVNYFREER